MNDKLVTHADLPILHEIQERIPHGTEGLHDKLCPLLDRLIAAAEADQPPLPEGWVVYTSHDGGKAVFWHRDGVLYQWHDDDVNKFWDVKSATGTITPLRPTVTEADVEKAAYAIFREHDRSGLVPFTGTPRETSLAAARAAFAAAGIEVRS